MPYNTKHFFCIFVERICMYFAIQFSRQISVRVDIKFIGYHDNNKVLYELVDTNSLVCVSM